MADHVNELDIEMPPLKVTCTSTDCERNLHCFLKRRGMPIEDHGACRACGVKLIDWERVHRRDLSDVEFIFASLKHEKIRHHMWHVRIDDEALRKVRRHGRKDLYASIAGRLRTSIGKPRGGWDGRQTPMQGNVIYYAQHATATCCRKCLSYWYDIRMDKPLTDQQLAYCEALIRRYLDERLPDLQDEKEPRGKSSAVVTLE